MARREKRRLREWGRGEYPPCRGGKKGYPNWRLATRAAKSLRLRKPHDHDGAIRVYWCKQCRAFEVGHSLDRRF